MFNWLFPGGGPTPPPSPPKPPDPTIPQSAATITNDTVAYTRTFPDLNNSSITTKINAKYPQSVYQDANSIDVTIIDNYVQPPGGGGIGCEYVNHVVNHRTIGGESKHNGYDLQSDLKSGFNIGYTQITHAKRLMGGYADSVWLNSFGPNSNFATTPDANGIIHKFDGGAARIGEINYGNAWGDFGLQTVRNGVRWVAGLELFPDWLTGSDGDQKAHHYHASWALCVGGAGPDAYGKIPKNWIGCMINVDGIVGSKDFNTILGPGSHGDTQGGGGYGWQINGSSDQSNPIGKGINFDYSMDVGIDMTHAKLTTAAMTLADDQRIKLGSTWLRGHQGHLQLSTDGTNWRNL